MNKSFKYALSVVLGASMAVPALAQRDNFPDVADTHWASEAVARLKKEGILTGYPDGTFKGQRMITRYELATVIYAIYMNLKNVTDGLDSQIKALEEKVNGMDGKTGGNGDASLKAQLEALKSDLNGMKAWGDDINMLKKMSTSYQKELTSLGVDVEKMKKDIEDLKKMTGSSMGKSGGVAISGDVNFWVASNSRGSNGFSAINQDGRYTQGYGSGAGLTNLTVLHELALKLDTEKAHGTVVVGNMVGANSGFGDQASVQAQFDSSYRNGGNTNIYLHDLYATLNDSVAGLGFNAKIGRQGFHISPYVLQRLDNTSFFENERYDNGQYALDGVTFTSGFGGNAKLTGFLGVTSNQNAGGGIVQPLRIGAEAFIPGANVLTANRAMGAVLDFGVGQNGGLKLSFVDFDSNTVAGGGNNRQEVLGADANFNLGSNIKVIAGAGQSTSKLGNSTVNDNDNKRLNAGVLFNAGGLDISAGYRRVEANYFAPGDWGRTGIYRNLQNLTAFDAAASFKLGGNAVLNGNYMRGEQINGTGEVDMYRAGIDYKVNGNWTLMASYEDTKFTNGWSGIGNPNFKFTTLGFGYDMGANTLFKLWYQYSDTANFSFPSAGVNPNGSFIAAQLSVKF